MPRTALHRADLLRYTLWLSCGEGAAWRGGTAYRFRGESLGIKKVLHSDRFYALLLLESLVQFPKLLSEKAEINDRKTLEKAIIAHYGNTGFGVFKWGYKTLKTLIFASYWGSLLVQFSKFKNFLLVCWFLGKNLSNFLTPVWKLHNPYCHITHIPQYSIKQQNSSLLFFVPFL